MSHRLKSVANMRSPKGHYPPQRASPMRASTLGEDISAGTGFPTLRAFSGRLLRPTARSIQSGHERHPPCPGTRRIQFRCHKAGRSRQHQQCQSLAATLCNPPNIGSLPRPVPLFAVSTSSGSQVGFGPKGSQVCNSPIKASANWRTSVMQSVCDIAKSPVEIF